MAFNPNIPAYSTQGKSFSRTAAFPLEGYEIWTDLEALKAYAANTDPAKDPSYIGQKIAYIDTKNNKVVHYSIEIDGSIRELGPVFGAEDEGKFLTVVKVVDQEAAGVEGEDDYQPEVSHFEYDWVEIEGENTVTTITSNDNSITITDTGADGNHIYDLKVNFPEIEIPEAPEYKIVKAETPTEGSQATYHLTKDGENVEEPIEIPVFPAQIDYTVTVDIENPEDSILKHYIFNQCGNEIAHIDIPKDLVVQSGSVIVATADDVTDTNGVIIGETYIKLVIANQVEPIYIGAKDLVDIYTVDDTNTIDMTITDTEITADVKISAKAGNSLVAEVDGLYVNVPILPNSADEAVANEYVTAVVQENGKITVSRKQISYNELADIPGITGENAIEVTNNDDTDKVIKLLIDEANKGNVTLTQSESGLKAEVAIPEIDIADAIAQDPAPTAYTESVIARLNADEHTVTPTVIDVVTKAAWDKINNAGEGQTAVRLISQTEIDKLAKLTLEDGDLSISGSVDAASVKGLYNRVVDIIQGSASDLDPETDGDQLGLGIEKGAQKNLIESIGLPDATLAIADKHVAIPYFLEGTAGVIKGAAVDSINKVIAEADGTGSVKYVSTDSFVQGEQELILNGGNASLS